MSYREPTLAARVAALAVYLSRACAKTGSPRPGFVGTPATANTLGWVADELFSIERLARRDATNLCNVPDFQDRFDASRKRLKARLGRAFEKLGLQVTCELHGDPRGSCLVLFHPLLPGSPGEGYRVG